jgi:uncharacterized membrane protein
MDTRLSAAGNPGTNRGALGVLWIIYGLIRLAVAVLLILDSGIATVMFGALLVRVANAFFFMDVFHFFYVLAIILALIAGAFSLLAGFALLGGRSSARPLSIAAGLLSVSDIPLGTTLGTYTLIVFLR